MRWVGLLMCWAGMLLPLMFVIQTSTETLTVAPGENGNQEADSAAAQAGLLWLSWPQLGVLLFSLGVIILLVNWRSSRVQATESEDSTESH